MNSRRTSFLKSGLDDEEILNYAKRINLGRTSETVTYQKNHVPKLKPKSQISLPSPMVLSKKKHTHKIEFDNLMLEEIIQE
jgi:hypothetical protein